jgi:hypothetical protein
VSKSGQYRNGWTKTKRNPYWDRFEGPPCRTLADMTEAEIVAIEREYGCPVIRPTSRAAQGSETRSRQGRGRRPSRAGTPTVASAP